MSASLLTVDLGNSRCKLRVWDPSEARDRLVRATVFDADGGLPAAVAAWLDEARAPFAAALSSVAAPALEEALRAVLASATTGETLTPPHGLELDVLESHTVGMDRLFAARGALGVVGGPAVVLDAGTALTVDALDVGSRGRGVFRGGAIAAGPELLAEALARGGARLPRIDPRPGARALGRSTSQAIAGGAVVGFRGAARELVQAVSEESGLVSAPLVVTGGAREFLLAPPLFEGRRLVVVEDLVHHGLLDALRDHLSGPRSAR